jgi:hypothetical protein
MSSIPIQFLINVLPMPTCSELPVILPLMDCLEVQVDIPINLTLYAINYCNKTDSIITDIFVSTGIPGMNISELFSSTINASLSYITLNWIPQSNQIGSPQFCTIAYTRFILFLLFNKILLLYSLVKESNLENIVLHLLLKM